MDILILILQSTKCKYVYGVQVYSQYCYDAFN